MKFKILALTFFGFFESTVVFASSDASEFLGECLAAVNYMDNPEAFSEPVPMIYANRCISYISGARDALTSAKMICVPQNVESGKLARLVVDYGNRNPEFRREHRLNVFVRTMMSSYPCKNG